MKILRIGSSGYEQGGIENGIVLAQPILEHLGHTVKTLASDDRPDLAHFNQYTYKKPADGFFGRLSYTFNLSAYKKLKEVLKEFQPDVVHVHTIGHGSASILFPLKKYPTIFTIHGPEGFTKGLLLWCLPDSDFRENEHTFQNLRPTGWLRYGYYRYFNRPLYLLGLRNVDVFVTLSRFMQDLMKKEKIVSEYIPNGTVLFDNKPLQSENISHKVLYVGRLEKVKGIDYLINALPRLLEKFPDSHLYIAGEGPFKPALEALTKKLGLRDHVSFCGHLNRSELGALYEQVAVLVVPSTWPEAFGKIGIEAMSVGRPVVATNVGGISDWLINGTTGFLVPPENSEAIADSLLRLFSDPALLIRMGVEARKKSEEFTLEKHVGRMVRIYERVIQESKKTT